MDNYIYIYLVVMCFLNNETILLCYEKSFMVTKNYSFFFSCCSDEYSNLDCSICKWGHFVFSIALNENAIYWSTHIIPHIK